MKSYPCWYKGKEERCYVCGRKYPVVELIRYEGKYICKDCQDENPIIEDERR